MTGNHSQRRKGCKPDSEQLASYIPNFCMVRGNSVILFAAHISHYRRDLQEVDVTKGPHLFFPTTLDTKRVFNSNFQLV